MFQFRGRNYKKKKIIRYETIEEYLARGGKITYCEPKHYDSDVFVNKFMKCYDNGRKIKNERLKSKKIILEALEY